MAVHTFANDIDAPELLMNHGHFAKKKKIIYYVCLCNAEIKLTMENNLEVRFQNAKTHLAKHCILRDEAKEQFGELLVSTLEELQDENNTFWLLPQYDEEVAVTNKAYALLFRPVAFSFVCGAVVGTILLLQLNLDKLV